MFEELLHLETEESKFFDSRELEVSFKKEPPCLEIFLEHVLPVIMIQDIWNDGIPYFENKCKQQ